MRLLARALLACALTAAAAAPAAAQMSEVSLDRGPASELYLRKRPPVPEAPVLAPELQKLLNATEKQRDAKRLEAVALLREFLAGKPEGDARADGLFKLAELLWEEARRTYLVKMDGYERELERCKQDTACKTPPGEPRIDLSESEKLYKTLLADHPDFRRADLVLYLVGFAAKEDGREDEAMARFQEVIERFPTSPLYGDAWVMVGEHHFAALDWAKARAAYANILTDRRAATYDLALFKTAWCDWKLGDVDSAARRFKEVLDLAVEAERAGSASQRRRRANLRDEALEYLVIVFTEDRAISAKEVFDFLASIGGEKYSRAVLVKVADAYLGQAEYDRAVDTFEFLIALEPDTLSAASWQRRIVETWASALDTAEVLNASKVLVESYGPGTAWAKAQRNRDGLARSQRQNEELLRTTIKNLHADAQGREKAARPPKRPKDLRPADLPAWERTYRAFLDKHQLVLPYTQTAAGYQLYLSAYADQPEAVELRFLRAQILYFKLGRLEEAGDEFLQVGKTAPVGKYHKDALLAAMESFERARPQGTAGKRQLLPVDKKFAEAIDLYATLFPADPELVGVIFRNGQLFYDYGEYDEAIKRFGVIVTKYPDHPDAGPAGDRILAALNKAQDYENIEEWARRLKGAKAFSSKDQQDRLDRLIVESIGKSGDKYAEAGKYEQAAGFYLRVPKEFPKNPAAPAKMMNAGVMYEKAKLPEKAADVYLDLARQYKGAPEAEKAAFAAGAVYERVVYFDQAAAAYEVVVKDFPRSPNAADALYNAGVLRQALGQSDKAIAHYQDYAKRYRDRKDAAEVAFRIGVVYEDAGDDGKADQAFRAYAAAHRDVPRRVLEAHVRSARTSLRLGQTRRAAEQLDAALKLYKRLDGKDKAAVKAWAAEARYYQGELLFKEYEKVTLETKPKLLERSLKKKGDLLGKARDVYLSVVDYEDLKWATASLYRVGQIYDSFAEALRTAPTPTNLSEAEQNAYREALDTYVLEIEETAIELFSTGYQKAIQMQVYDAYTKKIREALGRLSSTQYPPERESRAAARQGDRPLEIDLVEEVER
ncbi:MAG TPA: tetratricopeptide repeat protein [Kofleriaceae bacterium]|jgi:tetratricopeptide (TPR) repeat protein|nr:tetratricopeptide repeat protein [Kofleriaceae bacterium]